MIKLIYQAYLALLVMALAISCSFATEDKKLDSGVWLTLMQPAVAGTFCSDKNPIKACLNIDDALCNKSGMESVKHCIKQIEMEIPKQIGREEARTWGTKLGICTAKEFITRHQKNILHEKPQCKQLVINK